MVQACVLLRALLGISVIALAHTAAAVTIGPPVQVGTTSSGLLAETSGIVGSGAISGVLWMHSDSGDLPRFSAVSTGGTLLGQYLLEGAENRDWEDLALGPKPGGGSYLYLGDVGDNNRVRSSIQIYRTTEPSSTVGGVISAANYQVADLTFPGARSNTESLMVDPWTGDMFLVTKFPSGEIYRAPASAFDQAGQTTVLEHLGSIPLSSPSGADISPDGHFILVRNRSTTALLWERTHGQSIWDAMQGDPTFVTLAAETQGEAIGWAADGSGFYTVSEWSEDGPRPIYFYAVTVPEPGTVQLMMCGAGCGLGLLGRGRIRSGQRRASTSFQPSC